MDIRERVARFRITASSWIAYPEMRSALSRRHREGGLTAGDYENSLKIFDRDWTRFGKVPCDSEICRAAGELASRHRLRGMDAIHLASGLYLREREAKKAIEFLRADARHNRAAIEEGLSASFPA